MILSLRYHRLKAIFKFAGITLPILLSTKISFAQEYFQQEVNYSIHVSLNDQQHRLHGFESIEYINNSPDTLIFLYFHLWPNAYSNNKTPLARQLFQLYGKDRYFNDPELRGYIDSLDFKVDQKSVAWHLLSDQTDVCVLKLNNPLPPGGAIQITTPFHVKIPKGETSRLGHTGQAYQISQWYPKPAVYDHQGWHPMSYLDQGEFYSEFGRFNVQVTLPENYTVGATGKLQTTEELIRLEQLAQDTKWIQTKPVNNDSFPPSSSKLKTLVYTAENVHDFAWFADKRFHVMKGEVKLPGSAKTVTVWSMFTDNNKDLWKNANDYAKNALWAYSKWIGDYPYQTYTVVQSRLNAGAGMEYPGLAVIGNTTDAYDLDDVISHEIAHNWFYSALATNERQFPYMDESLTSAYTERYMHKKYPDKKLWELYFKREEIAKFFHIDDFPVNQLQEYKWLSQARENREQPIKSSSTELTYNNYNLMLYYKAAKGFNHLRAYLGDSIFDEAVQSYFATWKHKHPYPEDLQNTFQKNTTKDINWFFDNLLTTTKQVDYKLKAYKNRRLKVSNKRELAVPIIISGFAEDSLIFEKCYPGFNGTRWLEVPEGSYSEFIIDRPHLMPELSRMNNNYRPGNVFPKADPIQPQLYFSVQNEEEHTLMLMPALNWNKEDGFMLGMALHNGFIVTKPISYFLMPHFAFDRSGLSGYGQISFKFSPMPGLFRLAELSLEGSQFGAPGNQRYQKFKAGIKLFLKNSLLNPLKHSFYTNYIMASDLSDILLENKAPMLNFLQFGYDFKKKSWVNPFHFHAEYEYNQDFQKIKTEFRYRFSYNGQDRGLDVKLFTGAMLTEHSNHSFYKLAPAARSGYELYLYHDFYPDRFTNFPNSFWSRQMTFTEGGLVSPINKMIGYSDWLLSLTLTSNLPRRLHFLPIKPFANLLLNDTGLSNLFFELGVKTGYWDFFEFHIPFLVSNNIESYTPNLKDRIRFIFKIDGLKKININRRVKY